MIFTNGGNLLAMVNYAVSGYTTGDVGVSRISTTTGTINATANFTTTYKKRALKLGSDASGNIYFCGFNQLMGVIDQQAMLIKYNSSGTYQWANYYTMPGYVTGPLTDVFNDVYGDNSGNVYVAGGGGNPAGLNKEGYVKKYSSTGLLLSSATYSTAQTDELKFINKDISGNIVVAGTSGSNKVFYRKYNTSLGVLSTGISTLTENIYSATNLIDWLICPNGSVMFFLTTFPNLGNPSIYDAYVAKINASGTTIYNNILGPGLPYQLSFISGSNYPNSDFAIFHKYNSITGWVIQRFSIVAARMSNGDEVATVDEELSISVYPNPATSEILIAGLQEQSQTTVEMVDVQGKKVLKLEDYNSEKINVARLPRGIYMLSILNMGNILTTKKIILN